MASRAKKPSPLLGAAATLIEDSDHSFIAGTSRFKHSFEANIDAIQPDPQQARKVFDEQSIQALGATLLSDGQLQPVLVRRQPGERQKWILVAGERRWRAARQIGWKTMLAIEFDGDPEIASLIENLQRVDLAPREEASALRRLLSEKGWTQVQAAEALGKTKSEISGVLNILSLPEAVLDVLTSEHQASRSVLIELARLPEGPNRQQLIEEARKGLLTVRAIRLKREEPTETKSGTRQSSGFNFATLERVAARLNDLRNAKHDMSEQDRGRLIRLRQEINALLDSQ